MMKYLLDVPGYHSRIGIAGEGYFYADVWVSGEQEHGSATYVRARDLPLLKARLGEKLGTPVITDEELLEGLARGVGDVSEIRTWLEEAGVPTLYRFDPWAAWGATEGVLPEGLLE